MADKPQSTYAEIVAALGDNLDQIEVFHNRILVGIYMQPEQRASGLYIPDKSRDEDKWQGKVAAVLKTGPLAFQNDAQTDFRGQNVAPGDWVVYRVSDGFSIDINGVHCRLMEDTEIRLRVSAPEIIY